QRLERAHHPARDVERPLDGSAAVHFGNQILRAQIATVAGASVPYPYGGEVRQIEIDLKPAALRAQGLSPVDVLDAIATQNLIVPAGTEKIGGTEYDVKLNASPVTIDRLNDLPI